MLPFYYLSRCNHFCPQHFKGYFASLRSAWKILDQACLYLTLMRNVIFILPQDSRAILTRFAHPRRDWLKLIYELDPIPSKQSKVRQNGPRIRGQKKKCMCESNVNVIHPINSRSSDARQNSSRIPLKVKSDMICNFKIWNCLIQSFNF